MVLTQFAKVPVALRQKIDAAMPYIKPIIFIAMLYPLGRLLYSAFFDPFALGADPGRAIVLELGYWAMIALWLSLSITPLRKQLSLPSLIKLRKMLGLFASFYTLLHLLGFLGLMMGWRWDLIIPELYERPYVLLGMLATLGLIPLTMTSTKSMQRRLGKRWKQLHQLVYLIAIFVAVHYFLQIRAGFGEHLFYMAWLAVLLSARRKEIVQIFTKKAVKR